MKLQVSFAAIRSFSKAKNFVFSKRKENATVLIVEALQALYLRKLYSHVTVFRKTVVNKAKVDALKRIVTGQTIMKTLRALF